MHIDVYSYCTAVRQPHVSGINAHSTFKKANTFIDCQTIAVGCLIRTATLESERQFTKGLTTWISPSNDPTDEIWPLRSACCISSCHQKLAWQGQTHSYFHTSMKGVQSHNFISHDSLGLWDLGMWSCLQPTYAMTGWPALFCGRTFASRSCKEGCHAKSQRFDTKMTQVWKWKIWHNWKRQPSEVWMWYTRPSR